MFTTTLFKQACVLRNFLNNANNFNFAVSKKNIPRRFLNRQPNRQKIFTQQDRIIQYNPYQALELMRLHAFATFKQSVEVCIHLGVNPKNGQQIVRGSVFMPSGIGKQTKVAVLCSKNQFDELQEKGLKIDLFINEQQIKKLQKGIFEFEKLFTTPDYIGKLKHLGKSLGPKGLMPNAKVGTLVKLSQLQQRIKQAKAGQVTYRVDSGRNLHALIGKMDFTDDQLLVNFRELMKSLVDKRPPTLKGKYFISAYLKSTMGPRWKINLGDIDPKGNKSLWNLLDLDEAQTQPQSLKVSL